MSLTLVDVEISTKKLPSSYSLEETLSITERAVKETIHVAKGFAAQLKKLLTAAEHGELRDIDKHFDAASKSIQSLKESLENGRKTWDFETAQAYLQSNRYLEELTETAHAAEIKAFLSDNAIFSYPLVLRLLPKELVVRIGNKKTRKIRPKALVEFLKSAQKKPQKLLISGFAEYLFEAYKLALYAKKKSPNDRLTVPLKTIYSLINPLPWQAKEYSLQEFVRDIFLLDQAGEAITRNGYRLTFSGSTGSKNASDRLTAITPQGEERPYYGICFIKD